uniref:NADH-ubiquinone oxidoreductase chain 6 n=2 Tax=Carabidae TaxID=41073 RepID=A0A2U8XCR1_9CARA|nr:NADH dehydrogenase subunit 6 [Selenophorus alternans]AWN56432.1 NADH dehydrogenase subunit 6 [Tetracha sp. DPP-2018]
MFMIFMTSNIILSIMFMFMSHPMSMGLILLIQTTTLALMTGLMSFNFWFSYILFLVMVGGMLVLFIYMTSLASNEMFTLSINLTITFVMLTSMMMGLILIMDHAILTTLMKTSATMEMNLLLNTFNENLMTLNKIYNSPNNLMTIILINYLLLALIAVVKISSTNYGPLRQKF